MCIRRICAVVGVFLLGLLVTTGCGVSKPTKVEPNEKQKQKELPGGGPDGPGGKKSK